MLDRIRARLQRLLKKGKLQIPRTSSPRKRGYGRLGMAKVKDLPARLKGAPLQSSNAFEFFNGL